MNFSNLKFDSKDIVQLLGFVGVIGTMWYDLKTDYNVHLAESKTEFRMLDYRISKLEGRDLIASNSYRPMAILPTQPKLTEE